MKKFIKKQFLRGYNIIKITWKGTFVEFLEYLELTKFGKYFIGLMLFIILFFYTVLLIIFMPILLACLKYDESIGV